MNYIILIIVALAGIAIGMYIARGKANAGFIAQPLDCARDKQTEQKTENKQKIFEFVQGVFYTPK